MFSATISDIKLLRDSIDTISQIIDEANLKIKVNGIELTAADRAMVSVVNFKLSADAFDEYNYNKEAEIGLNLLNFLAILKRAANDDKLSLELDENKLNIILKGSSRRAFAIPLIDITKEEIPSIGQFDFPASIDVSTDILSRGIDDADLIADSIVIEILPECFKMNSEVENSKTELKLEKGSADLLSINTGSPVKSRYPLDYLKKMLKASKLVKVAKIQLGNDYPMKMDFVGDKVKIEFVLAPRVQEE